MNMQTRPPVEDMLMSRRETPGTGTGGAQALVNQMGPRPNMALPNSQVQTGMPQMPNSRQLVTGKDGKKYQVVIDRKTGLQTFIPYREPQRPAAPQGMPGAMPRMAQGQPGGAPQGGGELMNRLKGLLSARG
ncbi:MAG: hypothetical protein HOG19_10440 [Gammaproteobacteria bacterium]|nr:hypothetical protein [Gammaproteobacteria bacterium]